MSTRLQVTALQVQPNLNHIYKNVSFAQWAGKHYPR